MTPLTKLITMVNTRDPAISGPFYRDVLGLAQTAEDPFATTFEVGGIRLRLSTAPDFRPHGHTVIGFEVADIAAAVAELAGKGVTFNVYPGFGQDAQGIWNSPGGDARVAWFNDPDGNVLSLTQF